MTLNTDWEKNIEVLKVLHRLKREKEIRLSNTLLGSLFGRADVIKSEELKRIFGRRGIDFYNFSDFLAEDSVKYKDAGWKDTGCGEGYDKGVIVSIKPKPKSFSFTPYLAHDYVLSGPHERFEYKRERNPNQPIVETIDEKEALKLIDRGYSLLEKKSVTTRHVHCPEGIGPMDWPDPMDVEEQLFILAHPNTQKSDIDKHRIGWKPRHYVVRE